MQFEISTIPDTDIAYFMRSGPMDINARKDNRKCVLDYCKKHGLCRVIIDARNQRSSLSLVECFNFGADTAVLMKRIRIAVLHKEGDESISYTVNSAGSRGLEIKGFQEKEAAIRWLS